MDNDATQSPGLFRSKAARLWGTLLALLLACFLLVGIVMPAEYSLDPFGTGRALGLLGLAEGGAAVVIEEQQAHRTDEQEFVLAPFESVEYSFELAQGATMVFSWQATDEVVFNLHSSPLLLPDGAAIDYAESFSSGRERRAQGTYTAPFTGRHGWFWENRNAQQVRLKLLVSGFIWAPRRSSVSGEEQRQLQPVFGILPATPRGDNQGEKK